MRVHALICWLGAAVLAAGCGSNNPPPPAPAPLKELWRGYTTQDEYWVQVVAHEDMKTEGPVGEVGGDTGYRWKILWGGAGGVAIENRRLLVNGQPRGDLLTRGDRIQVNASTGRVTVNGLTWD